MARILAGPIPDPEDLYGREAEIEQCWEILGRGNLILLAPRRFGKSGLMRHLEQRPRGAFQPVWLHLEHVVDGPGFAELLIEALHQNAKLAGVLRGTNKWLKDKFDRIESVEGASIGKVTLRAADAPAWQKVVTDIVMVLEKTAQPILFLCDELPAMIKAMAKVKGEDEARRFMQWFRSLRLNSNNQLKRHRFVVAGSTGLNYFLGRRLACVETINDFERLPIEPLSDAAGRTLCRELASAIGTTIEEPAIDHLMKRIGRPVPYFLHVFFSAAQQLPRDRNGPLTIPIVDRTFDERVLSAVGRGYFDHYRQRLSHYGPGVERAAVKILAQIASKPKGEQRAALRQVYDGTLGSEADIVGFADLMSDLEVDFYLVRDAQQDTFVFYLSVMSDWWKYWYGSTAESAGGR